MPEFSSNPGDLQSMPEPLDLTDLELADVAPHSGHAIDPEATNSAIADPAGSEAFYKTGTAELHHDSPRRTDVHVTAAQMAERTDTMNRREYIDRNFIDIEPVYRQAIPEEGIVQVMLPSNPYAYGGVMVVAASDSMINGQEGIIPTHTAFDLDDTMRDEYYKQILACIQAQEDTPFPREESGTKVVAYENTLASISTAERRLPRTLALPHTHVFKEGEWINPDQTPARPIGSELEKQFLQDEELFLKFQEHWLAAQQTPSDEGATARPSISQRRDAPFGYTINSTIARDQPLEDQSESLARLLDTNHQAYARFVQSEAAQVDSAREARREEFAQNNDIETGEVRPLLQSLVVQPSFRTYIYYQDGSLKITISPMLVASVGALEAMEVGVNRSLENKQHYTDDELTRFSQELTDRLHASLDARPE